MFAGEPAGVVTFAGVRSPGRELRWGFYLDIAGLTDRGELLSAWVSLERATVAYAFDVLDAKSLGGETLESNSAVVSLHRRFGFRVVRRYQRDVDGVAQAVVWTELSRSVDDVDG
jgi:hypothetical protein